MTTETRERHTSDHLRAVDIRMDVDIMPSVDDKPTHVASIASNAHDDRPRTPPQITFHPGRDGNGYPMNHAQWEVFKREADAAWALYETTWPAEADEPTQGG